MTPTERAEARARGLWRRVYSTEQEFAEAIVAVLEVEIARADAAERLECCDGCGSTRTTEELRVAGHVACCPERKMLTMQQWRERCLEAERRADGAEGLSPTSKELRERVFTEAFALWQSNRDEIEWLRPLLGAVENYQAQK